MKGYAPFLKPAEVLYHYYPDLKPVLRESIRRNGAPIDILFLGGSVLDLCCGDIAGELPASLEKQSGRPVRVYNLSKPALNSLDAFYKYSLLKDQRFDLVLFYESINETRVNNCTDEFFREDYSHYACYDELRVLRKHLELRFFALPFTAEWVLIRLRARWRPDSSRFRTVPSRSRGQVGRAL